MGKTMTFRFEPGMGILLREIADDLTNDEVRFVTKTEVIERAVAVLHSLVASGNIKVLSTNAEIQAAYRQALARIHGLDITGGGKE